MVTPGSLIALNFIVGAGHARAGAGRGADLRPHDQHAAARWRAEVVRVGAAATASTSGHRYLAAAVSRTAVPVRLPSFHNPTGRTLTGEQRRARLADARRRARAARLEDDPYRDVRIDGAAAPHPCTPLLHDGCPCRVHVLVLEDSCARAAGRATRCCRRSSSAPVTACATRTYVSPPLLPRPQPARVPRGRVPARAPEFLGAACSAQRRDALVGSWRRCRGVATLDAPRWRLLPLARAARRVACAACWRTARAPGWTSCRAPLFPAAARGPRGAALVQLPVGGGGPHGPPDRAAWRSWYSRTQARSGMTVATSSSSARTDIPVEGPPRELVGYGAHPPPKVALGTARTARRVAVQIVLNYEEGSEKTFAMGDGVNDILYELPFALEGQRDLAVESMYEYGTRAGIWRLLRVFDNAGIPVTLFAAAVALERNPEVGRRNSPAAATTRRPRLPLEQPLRDDPRRGARGDPAGDRVDRVARGRAAARLVLPRDERQHARAGRRGGRLRLRLRLLQRRPAVLDRGRSAGRTSSCPTGSSSTTPATCCRRVRQPGALLPDRQGEPGPAPGRRRRRAAHDVDRPAPADQRQPGAVGRAWPGSSTTRSSSTTSRSRAGSTSRGSSPSSTPRLPR